MVVAVESVDVDSDDDVMVAAELADSEFAVEAGTPEVVDADSNDEVVVAVEPADVEDPD